MEKPLSQQLSDGMKYFARFPEKVGTKQWNVFKRTVLEPRSEELIASLSEEDRKDVGKVLKKFKGYLIKTGG